MNDTDPDNENANMMAEGIAKAEDETPAKTPMTQEECENWILLKGQSNVQWFKVVIDDPEVADDPTMIALMESITEVIFAGMLSVALEESLGMHDKKPELEIVQ